MSERSERVCVKRIKDFFNEKMRKGEKERRKKCKKKGVNTGGRFRSYGLWGVIHNHPQVVPQVV